METENVLEGTELEVCLATVRQPPVTIERVFNLGDYKSLRVMVNSDDIGDIEKIALKEVAHAYIVLFTHNLFQAHLEQNEQQIEYYQTSIEQVKIILNTLLEEN